MRTDNLCEFLDSRSNAAGPRIVLLEYPHLEADVGKSSQDAPKLA